MKVWLALMGSCAAVWAGEPPAGRLQQAAAKAVVIIQQSQKNWYHKQGCISCHQQIFPAIALRVAREHGIAMDEQAAHANLAAAFGYFSDFARAVEYKYIIDPALNDGYSLMAANAAGVRPSLVTAVYARLLAARQEADGRWDTIDERPPESYSPFTATAVAVRAIQLYAHPSQKADVAARVERAKGWLLSHAPHATEERVYQLMGAYWCGTEDSAREKMAVQLERLQQRDGGWSSLDGRPSDAYSTGQTLLALHEAAGLAITDPVWKRGIAYLLRTQAQDGSWHVASRLHPPAPVSPDYFETGHPYGHDQFISMMGDSLALMALTTSLGPAKAAAPVLKEAEPSAIEPWAETMLFGSTAAVKKLLEDGFDPNSATRSGGLTALMLATPDVEKMKLLIERGANVDARAKDRYSALLVAAQYPGSGAAMNLLLDHGAKVRLPAGQGAAMFNAYPTFLAGFSGDANVIARLHEAGDRMDEQMNVAGFAPTTPMMFLATTCRTDSVRALLDAGAKVDETDPAGITVLAWAAIANRVDMARLLIERGADVNHVDKLGMTPLLYAASIDFGDSAMIDLLLRSGARLDARNKDGKTALDLARAYGNTHLLASLEGERAAR